MAKIRIKRGNEEDPGRDSRERMRRPGIKEDQGQEPPRDRADSRCPSDPPTEPESPKIVTPTDEEVARFSSETKTEGSAEKQETPPAPEEAARQAEEYLDHLRRLQAEFENFRKRTDRERSELHRRSISSLVGELLEVLDAFDRATHSDLAKTVPENYRQGIEMVQRMLCEILSRNGLKRIEAVGEPFDPNLHEALMQEETDEVPPGFVSSEITPGYLLHDSLLRPSAVKVSTGPSRQKDSQQEREEDSEREI
jgi:molecular chaperone GrpE